MGTTITCTSTGDLATSASTFASTARALVLAILAVTGCAAEVPSIRPTAHAGVIILPVEAIADLDPPFALRLLGRHPRLPVYLHVNRVWDFSIVAGRCGPGGCPVEYDAEDDRFECSCTGDRYAPNGRALEPGKRPLHRYTALYRDEVLLIDLLGSGLPGSGRSPPF